MDSIEWNRGTYDIKEKYRIMRAVNYGPYASLRISKADYYRLMRAGVKKDIYEELWDKYTKQPYKEDRAAELIDAFIDIYGPFDVHERKCLIRAFDEAATELSGLGRIHDIFNELSNEAVKRFGE